MIVSEQITQTIGEMKQVCNLLWQCDEKAYQEFEQYCADWMNVINQAVTEFSIWAKENEDIPLDIIFQQIRNLENALKEKDDFMLADTLQYEISNMLEYYLEMAGEYGRE